MVMASTNSTDGSGFPTDMGDPRSLTAFPLKATWVPGCDDAQSIGILGWLVAQPKVKTMTDSPKMIRTLFKNIKRASFLFPNELKLIIQASKFN
jgi:hypothetical protein